MADIYYESVTMQLVLALFGPLLALLANGDNIDRIYQGWHLSPHEFPWMVKLKVSLTEKSTAYGSK